MTIPIASDMDNMEIDVSSDEDNKSSVNDNYAPFNTEKRKQTLNKSNDLVRESGLPHIHD